MTRLLIPFDDVRELVLYACYVAVAEQDRYLIDGDTLSAILNKHVTPAMLARHFDKLQYEEGLLTGYNSSYRRVPDALLLLVEDKLKNKISPYFQLHKYGSDWLLSRYAFGDEFDENQPLVPASDRIVTISDNDREASAIVDQSKSLSNGIRTSNDLDMSPEEREAAMAEVSLIGASFEGGSHRVETLASIARRALRWIADKAGGALVGAAAIALLGAILVYLGLAG